MSSDCLYLFGNPQFSRDGETVPLQRRKGMALLAYFAFTAQVHGRESLATMLWPDYDQSRALANLRRDLSWLKNALGDHVLEIDRINAGLSSQSSIWVDVTEFRAKIQDVHDHDHDSGHLCPQCLQNLTDAVALYKNDFMKGFNLPDSPEFDQWQFFQADSLRGSLATALQLLVQEYAHKAEYEPAIEHARRWLALDPLHEPAHRGLMTLYAISGQQAAALRQYQECARILEEELDISPDEETTALYHAIRTKQFPPPESAPQVPSLLLATKLPGDSPPQKGQPAEQHNLPIPATPFIGRSKELLEVQNLLLDRPGIRLLTILGPGGIGKTRLALEVGRTCLEKFKHGVYFISLSSINDSENITFALAEGIGFQFYEASDHERQILDYLRGKQILLIMDNFEHLLPGSDLLSKILQTSQEVKILTTSRQSLELSSETLYVLEGLSYPVHTEAANALEYEAVKLLLQSARKLQPNYEQPREDLQAIVRICRLVQGMPLALILAAGWIELLSFKEIADEIDHGLGLLETEMRDIPERQRSVRAVFDYSWKLLSREQQHVLMKLTLFHGGFTRQAAQAVAGASLRTLLDLINKSWLQRDEDRFRIHELLRQYSQARLVSQEKTFVEANLAYSCYYAQLLSQLEDQMKGVGQKEAFNTLAAEFENVKAAWNWLVQNERWDQTIRNILPALFRFSEARVRSFELLQLLQSAITALSSQSEISQPDLLATLLIAKSAFFRNGYPVRFEIFGIVLPAEENTLQQAWSLVGTPQNLYPLGFWGILLTYLYGRIIDLKQGITQMEHLVAHYRQANLPWELAFALQQLMQLLEIRFDPQTDPERIERSALEALEIFKKLGDQREYGFTMRSFGQLYRFQHAYVQAIQYWKIAQDELHAAGDWAIAADINWQLGDIHIQMGEFESAFQYYQKMAQVYLEKGHKRTAAQVISKESYEALRYSDIDHAWQTRQQSLAYSHQVGDIFGQAWSTWELGEVHRVMGDYEAARAVYEEAKSLFEQFDDPSGYIFYHRGLGDIDLVLGEFNHARRQFQDSLDYARQVNHVWGMSYALTGLGRAALGLQDLQNARRHLLEALQRAKQVDELGITLVALGSIVGFLATNGELEIAYELGTLVKNYNLTWRETKEMVGQLLDSFAADLPLDRVRALQSTESQVQDVRNLTDQLIDKLSGESPGY